MNPHDAIDFIIKNSKDYAKAKANVTYLTEYRKTAKAFGFQKSLRSTMAEKESDAYTSNDYLEVLNGLKEAVEEAERLRWMLVAAEARIQVWRSTEASNRTIDKAAQ